MRRISIVLAVLLSGLSTAPVNAFVELVVETRTFHIPNSGPRVEVNMAMMAGTTVIGINQRGFMQARVEALTIIEQNGVIKAFSKVEILGPERLDSIHTDLLHQEFFDLAPGQYNLYVEVRDLNSNDTTATRYNGPLAVGELPNGVYISEILLAERFEVAEETSVSKYGYLAVPLLSDYFPPNLSDLNIYAEIYGTDDYFGPDSAFLITYQVEKFERGTVHGAFKGTNRARGSVVVPLMAQFDISDLPSGNYTIAVQVLDRKGELVARRDLFIQRNNPISYQYDPQAMETLDVNNTFAGAFANVDSLAESISSLRPIADPLERKIIDDRWKDRDMDLMKRFFYSFWANRDQDPERAWRDYRAQVIKVNQLFSCRLLKGYESDRGYVYLKYGAPNTMMDRLNEMDALPYSIWHYYRAGKYTNRRFVFYQSSMANMCFELLHSEVPGEIQNPRWNQIIHSRNVAMPNVDPRRVNTQSGERADEFYELPR